MRSCFVAIILIIVLTFLLFTNCTNPDKKANKLFVEASQLVNQADAETSKLIAYKRYNKALEKINNITKKHPSSQLAVQIVQDLGTPKHEIKKIKSKIKYVMVPAFLEACQIGDMKTMPTFLKDGIYVNARDDSNKTALMYASLRGHSDIAKLLIDKGADINACSDNYDTALILTTTKGNVDIAKLLIKKGANVHQQNNNLKTALMGASFNGNYDLVKLIIDKGAYINLGDKDGNSALTFAVKGWHVDVVKLLLENGADATLKNKNGLTALTYAEKENNNKIVKILRNSLSKYPQ